MAVLLHLLHVVLSALINVILRASRVVDLKVVYRWKLDKPILHLIEQYVPFLVMNFTTMLLLQLLTTMAKLLPFLGNPKLSPEMRGMTALFKAEAGIELSLWRARFVLGGMHWMYPLIKDVQADFLPQVGARGSYFLRTSREPNSRVLLWFYGGALFGGNAVSWQGYMGAMGKKCDCDVLLPDSRLAREHQLADMMQDCVEAYKHLLETFEPHNIIVGGVSSGGFLAYHLLTEIRSLQLPMPAGAATLSAWLDLSQSTPSLQNPVRDVFITKKVVDFVVSMCTGLVPDEERKSASPLFRGCEQFPPILLVYSDVECCSDENEQYAQTARAGGVDVTTYIAKDQMHAWALFQHCPEGQKAQSRLEDWIVQRLAQSSHTGPESR